MGTCTATIDFQSSMHMLDGGEGGQMVMCQITMSNSYAAGGDTLNAATLSLKEIRKLTVNGFSIGGATTAFAAAPVYTGTSGGTSPTLLCTKLQCFGTGAGGAGVAFGEASGNLSAVTFDCIAYGTT